MTEKNFQQIHEIRNERLLLKAIMVWIKLRFSNPLNLTIPSDGYNVFTKLVKLEKTELTAIISNEDAWILEKNAILFGLVAKKYLEQILPNEIYSKYGSPTFLADRKSNIMDIALLPPTFNHNIPHVMPCSMYIVKKIDLVKKFKNSPDFMDETKKQLDIIMLLKQHIDVFLNHKEQTILHNLFDDYKDTKEVLKLRQEAIDKRNNEEQNLNSILKVIKNQDNKTTMTKLAIMLYTVIEHTYKTNPQNVMKIRYGVNGNDSIYNFSRAFEINYDIDLHMVQRILAPIMSDGIKIKIFENKILFTTTNLTPSNIEDMKNVLTSTIESEEQLNQLFDTNVGPMVSVDEVKRITQRFLQEKYRQD